MVEGRSLTQHQSEAAMRLLLAGESTPALTAAFLTALRMKGETIEELGRICPLPCAAQAAVPLSHCGDSAYRPLLDTCGTGGNGTSTFNISTVAAFVVAGAGVRVAKHGNRSITSKCGSADILEALGVRTRVEPDVVARAICEAGIGFLFAPSFHTSTRHVQPVRLELKFRTAFNYLGPLTNPARAEIQVCGTWSDEAAAKIAGALALLGLERGFVVHGSDGLGEVTITGPTTVFSIRNGTVERMTVTPRKISASTTSIAGEAILGADAERNRAIAESILDGDICRAPRAMSCIINAALAIVAAEKTPRIFAKGRRSQRSRSISGGGEAETRPTSRAM